MIETKPPIASQAGHFYDRISGAPVYEVPCTSKDGNRPTTIKDARKLDLVPSVTLILNAIAKPGLEQWKATQLLHASLTLPKEPGESLDDYSKRVIEDAKAQGIAAAERGVQLHAAIEHYIAGRSDPYWADHLIAVDTVLGEHGIDLHAGRPEHTFSTGINGMFFGGKTDFHIRNEPVLIDFKSKDVIKPKQQLAYDDHVIQIAAYGYGLFSVISSTKAIKVQPYRGLNVFVGVNDCEVRVVEHSPADLEQAFSMFTDILSYWHKKNHFGKFEKGGEQQNRVR